MALDTIEATNQRQANNWTSQEPQNIQNSSKSSNQLHENGLEILSKSTFHGLPDLISANSKFHQFCWFVTLALAIGFESVHMYFLLVSAMESATVTKISYEPIQSVPFPVVTICGKPTKLLDSKKLAAHNISLSVALSFISLFGFYNPLLNRLNNETELQLYHTALELKSRMFSETEWPESSQLLQFLQYFTVDCESLFISCLQGAYGVGKFLNCCQFFRPVLTGQGICYSSNTNHFNRSNSAGVFSGLSVVLSHNFTTLDDSVYSGIIRPCNFAISISNGVEQGPLENSYVVLTPGDNMRVLVTATHLQFDPQYSRNQCEVAPQLDFFADYTIDNCVWERSFFRSPMTPNCSLAFEYLKSGFNFTQIDPNKIFITSDGYEFAQCRPEVIRRDFLNPSLTYSDWVTRINVPQRPNRCPLPCDYWDYSTTVNRDRDSFDIDPINSLLSLSFSNQNPKMTETVAIAAKDYLSMAGGTMGL